ncbi:hypothetical protein [Arthrobacter cavernae]|uniref:Tyr recombinase domain-containing protein n=1 Tax=Arthrobacter cavernae TaxID=2817681 RepID=A0A939HL20_9MICC|nr:hypothetical protein [Arthrobacter cavernae]MBO1269992.1 hypothetical protein [Arthrobacter cavernae]
MKIDERTGTAEAGMAEAGIPEHPGSGQGGAAGAPAPGGRITAPGGRVTGHGPGGLAGISPELERLRELARAHREHAVSANTERAYRGDWAKFQAWCSLHGLVSLPAGPDTVAMYLADRARLVTGQGAHAYKPSTLQRWMAAIAGRHAAHGHPSPTRTAEVSLVLSGIARERQAPVRRMVPLLLDDLKIILAGLDRDRWPHGVAAARDAFILLSGFAGAFRRSELAALTVGAVKHHVHDGLHVRVASSKTDQEGRGTTRALPYGQHPGTCPVCAWTRWMDMLEAARQGRAALMRTVFDTPAWEENTHVCRRPRRWHLDPDTPLLRAVSKAGDIRDAGVGGHALNAIAKRRAASAGFGHDDIGFHSLRAGFVTQARRNGFDARSIRLQTGHRSDAMVDVYDREYVPLAGGNAVLGLGL